MDEKGCSSCKHFPKMEWDEPCRDCKNSKRCLWEPKEEEPKEVKKDAGKDTRPRPLPMPVCISGPEDGRLPELIRIAFDDGTTAVYRLKEAENDQLIIKSIEIIRKWNRPRRRRARQP